MGRRPRLTAAARTTWANRVSRSIKAVKNAKRAMVGRKAIAPGQHNVLPHGRVTAIDVVYTWVGDTAQLRDMRMHHLLRSGQRGAPTDNSSNRYADNGELRYSLRSIYTFAPWVRRIFIVCDDHQRPPFLSADAEQCSIPVTVVKHSQLFTGDCAAHLPTFNSQAIEAHLHKIPGLSEHFIYFNDDMFLGQPCTPGDFFTASGSARYLLHGTVPKGPMRRGLSKHAMAWINNTKLLDAIFPRTRGKPRQYPTHQAVSMLKSSFENAWASPLVRRCLLRTSASRFRGTDNIYLIGFLVYWNIYQKMANRGHHEGFYVNLHDKLNYRAVLSHLMHKRPHLFCLNDNMRSNRLDGTLYTRRCLEKYFPTATILEVSETAGAAPPGD